MDLRLESVAVSDLINLFDDMKISNLSPLIVHSFDVAKISSLMMKRIGIGDSNDVLYAYLSGLFHDIGLLALTELKMPKGVFIATKADISQRGESFNLDPLLYKIDKDYIHSRFSYEILRRMKILPSDYLKAVLNHHTPLDELTGNDREILLSNLINVADMMAQMIRKSIRWGASESIRVLFDLLAKYPMVNEVKKAAKDLINSYVEFGYVLDDDPYIERFCNFGFQIGFHEAIEFLKAMVLLVDLRSPFTLSHTSGVAILARDLASEMLKTDFDSLVMYVAGLMHDLGKIKTPLEVLHKPGKLDMHEAYIMKMHVVDTYKMFSKYPKFEEFTAIASTHHERLDGSGYPWGLKAKDLGMRSRILQVADVYEALTENRPYREGMKPLDALGVIENMVNHGKLDLNVYESLKQMVENGYEVKRSDVVLVEFFGEFENVEEVKKVLDRIS